MKKWQKEIVDNLYTLTNRIGSLGDLTAVNIKKLIACTKANQHVSTILLATFFEEDKEKAERLVNELELLSRWNFPDKNGCLSDEEKQLNTKTEQLAEERGLNFFFYR